MIKRYIVDKDTGKFLYFGRDKKQLIDAGHTEVDASNTKPDGDFYSWDGLKWVEDKVAKTKSDNRHKLQLTDAKMTRVSEDLIDLLGNVANLPQSAQDLINERKTLRNNI